MRVTLTPELVEALRLLSRRKGVPVSYLAEDALRRYCVQHRCPAEDAE